MHIKTMTINHHSCLFIKELSFVLTSLFLFIYLLIYFYRVDATVKLMQNLGVHAHFISKILGKS